MRTFNSNKLNFFRHREQVGSNTGTILSSKAILASGSFLSAHKSILIKETSFAAFTLFKDIFFVTIRSLQGLKKSVWNLVSSSLVVGGRPAAALLSRDLRLLSRCSRLQIVMVGHRTFFTCILTE